MPNLSDRVANCEVCDQIVPVIELQGHCCDYCETPACEHCLVRNSGPDGDDYPYLCLRCAYPAKAAA